MIKSLRLVNFQSHADSKVEFCPGVNVITGTSDSGKSALLRALYWTYSNRPNTTSFIRTASCTETKKGAKKLGTAEVTIEIERDKKVETIVRTRGASANSYKHNADVFDVVGKDVPEQIQKALNLDKINIQKQLDVPFLMLETPGAVAATFNKFTDLERIGVVVDLLTSDLRDATVRKNTVEEQLKQSEIDIAKYTYLKEFEELVAVYEELEKEQAGVTSRVEVLNDAIDNLTRNINEKEMFTNAIQPMKKKHKEASSLFVHLKEIAEERDKKKLEQIHIQSILDSINEQQARLSEISKKTPVRKKEIVIRKDMFSLATEGETIKKQFGSLSHLLFVVQNEIEKQEKEQKAVVTLKSRLVEAKKQLEGVDTCITCGQALDAKSKKIMMENLA